jgi:hypothetical protein
MRNIESVIEKCGIPARNLYEIPKSELTFPDGAHYRMEISGIDSVSQLEALIDEMDKRNVPIHRVICMGQGTNKLTKRELIDIAQMGKETGLELIVVPTPRSLFDLGKHVHTSWGQYSGIRVRGSDNILYLVKEIERCVDAGINGFLLYGEDMLFLLNQMRKNGDLPEDIILKVSYTQGIANAAGAKLLENLGADSVNPITDLTLPMLASLRKVVKIPLDIVVISFEALGNINRFWEAREIVKACSPCYLKQELETTCDAAREKVKYCEIMRELISPDSSIKLSDRRPNDLRIPTP